MCKLCEQEDNSGVYYLINENKSLGILGDIDIQMIFANESQWDPSLWFIVNYYSDLTSEEDLIPEQREFRFIDKKVLIQYCPFCGRELKGS